MKSENGVSHSASTFEHWRFKSTVRGTSDPMLASAAHVALCALSGGPVGLSGNFPKRSGRSCRGKFKTPSLDDFQGDLQRKNYTAGERDDPRGLHRYTTGGGVDGDSHGSASAAGKNVVALQKFQYFFKFF